MKKKKFLKKLIATALGLGLGISSMAPAGAMSSESLWKKILECEKNNSLVKDYDKDIKPELIKNGFDDSKIQTAKSHLQNNAVAEFKDYVSLELAKSQSEIDQIKLEVKNKKLELENNITASLGLLNKYSNYAVVKRTMNSVDACKNVCQYYAKEISEEDASLNSVRSWQEMFNKNYDAIQKNIREASTHINNLENNFFNPNPISFNNNIRNGFNSFSPFGFSNMLNNFFNPDPLGFNNNIQNGFNSFSPFGFCNMQNNFFNPNPLGFNNNIQNGFNNINQNQNRIINNSAAPAPIVQNNANNAQAKKDLEERFRRLSAGNQQIGGPCWLYATTTAINEFRDKTNSGPIIKRLPGDEREYGPVELEYTAKGFENPLSINDNGPNGKTTYDILDYARKQGIEARWVMLFKQDHLAFSHNDLVKFTADLLREHFRNNSSPVLVEKPLGAEFHEVAIAGIVGNEFLVVDSLGDRISWQPMENLSQYCKRIGEFELVFFGGKENQNSEHEGLFLAGFSNINHLNQTKNNLLRFARGKFNMKSALEG